MKKCKRLPRVLYCLIGKIIPLGLWLCSMSGGWPGIWSVRLTSAPRSCLKNAILVSWTARSLVSSLKIGERIGSLTLEKVCISFSPDSRDLCLARSLMLTKFLKWKDPQFRDIHGTCEPSIKNCTSRVLEQTYGMRRSLLLKRRKSSG